MTLKYKMLSFFLAGLTLLSGCNLIPFEDPEEQRRKAEEAATLPPVELPDPQAALEADRVFSRTLKNQAGTLLATYEVRLPNFSEEGIHGEIFKEVNSHYDVEFSEAESDCEGFFEGIKRQYGEEWDLLETIASPAETRYTYQLLPTPEKYICIEKTYTYTTERGSGYVNHYPDVFLAENGWRLSFDSLFGQNAVEAEAMVMAGILEWCEVNGVAHERMGTLTSQDFTEFYAMDESHLIFYAIPFMLSTNDATAYTILLDIGPFEALMIE